MEDQFKNDVIDQVVVKLAASLGAEPETLGQRLYYSFGPMFGLGAGGTVGYNLGKAISKKDKKNKDK